MKRIGFPSIILVCMALFSCGTPTDSNQRAIPLDRDVEAQVERALADMTLDEKIGQMCELTIDVITDQSVQDSIVLNEETLKTVFGKYKVGSILNVPKGVAQKPEVWSRLIRRLNQLSMENCAGVPQIYGVDQIHGASYTWGATLFPQEVGQAASFNRAIPYRISEITAYESRACLIPWVYSPVMDLGRNALWPRLWESYGEDVFLSCEMARQAVLGYQGNDPNHIGPQQVAACVKHYMAYGVPRSGKDRTPSYITRRELREKFFQPFKAAIQAGALSLMVNSSNNDGLPFHADHELLTTWLKDELGWDGMIVTDWADINNLYTRDHVAASKKEAIAMAVNAGIDMSMVPYETDFCDLLHELVEEGEVSQERIDDAVRRVLRLKVRLGLFDKQTWDFTAEQMAVQFPQFASMDFAKEATEMAQECMVLLKNELLGEDKEALLPLKEGTRLLVCGPNANNLRGMNGGWSYTWQGDRTNELASQMGHYPTFVSALTDRFGAANVQFVEGVRWTTEHFNKDEVVDISAATAAASRADVVICCIGENSYCETLGNIDDLTLSQNQLKLVKSVAAAGKPIVLVLAEGRPRIISEIEPLAKAVVHTFLPSNYGGIALAQLLAGDANFSGRMPYTYPRHTGSLVTYDYKPCENQGQMAGNYNYDAVMAVQWPFGYGLSYTTFSYSNLRVDKAVFNVADSLMFCVDVMNTGRCAGKEAVLLFVSDLVASLSPDNTRLRAFEKVELQPGEKKTVCLQLAAKDLAFVGQDMRWRLEAGDFLATVGDQLVELHCNQTRIWEAPNP
ncbi:MAG: glycoside hydrolase family 3 C-terminal domain-containing protein [Bacteroidaceae bacterium]|nr:glycoside hydrolase family 3 C-terminal domain-containing protein [Bacteroidaceae bacterium]